jgi:hypothetical protein
VSDDPDPADPFGLRVRRVPGEDAVERELAPPVRVRVVGFAAAPDDDADLLRVDDLDVVPEDPALARVAGLAADPDDEALVRAAGVAAAGEDWVTDAAEGRAEDDLANERSTSCSSARTRCWRRATSSRLAMPRTPSWRFTSRWTMRVRISRFFWVRRIRSSVTRFTWAVCTSPCLASRDATRSAWVRVRSLRLASACRYCSPALGTSPPPAHIWGQDSVSGPATGQRTRVAGQPVW